ncbi:MAG TPA: hypothetical protein DDY91_19205, partial [Planctomycetaceae bacterium]|nr:hypothetical protein [Planctomycetaceae bacterium]
TYDAGTTATVDSRSLTGVETGDDVSLTGGSAAFGTKTVGTGKTVTLTGASLTGGDATNYTLSSVDTTTADITAKNVTGAFTVDTSKTYDGTTAANVLTRSITTGVLGSDIVTLVAGTATYDNRNVGVSKVVTLSGASLGGADGGNYQLTSVADTSAAITRKDITGTFTASNKTYDGTTTATIASRGLVGVVTIASVTDDVALAGGTASFANSNAANGKTVSPGILSGWSLTGSDAGNYTLTSVGTTTADITKRTLVVTATAANKTYDTTTGTTASLSTDKLALDVVTVTYTAANFADANAGTGKTVNVTGVSMGGASSGNYNLPSTTVTTTANITKYGLTLSYAVETTKTYDGSKAATVTGSNLIGILGDDTVTVSGLAAEYNTKDVGTNKSVSLTSSTLEGAQGGNYEITTVTPVTANITPKTVTATFTASNKTYDGGTSGTISGSNISGAVTGDTVSLTGTATFNNKNVGAGKTVTLSSASLTGADAANYTLSGSVPSTTANITVRTVTPVFTADNKVVDGTTEATLTWVSDDRVSGDAGTTKLNYTYTATFANAAVGTWTVTVTGIGLTGTESANYTINDPNRSYTATILPEPNNPPDVTTTSGTTSYSKGQSGVIVDSGVTVSDDSADFDTGYLQVTIIENLSTGDVLAISSQGTGTGQISVTGSNVFYEGVQIGTITQDGTNGDPLVVTLNAASNATNVQALARRITFANTETLPATDVRTIQFEVADGDGGYSAGQTKDVIVLTSAPPVVTASSGAVTYTESTTATLTPAIVIDSAITVTDSDSAKFTNGSLTVSYAANGTDDDRLTIRSTTTTGQINVSGTDVRITVSSGVYTLIGTFTGGTGTTPLVVTLNANATAAYTQVLMRNIMFQNVSNAPSIAQRSVSFVVHDGEGGVSTPGLKAVNVVGTNDKPVLSGLPASLTYSQGSTANPSVLAVAPSGIPTDPDGDGYSAATPFAFFNAKLQVRVVSGSSATERMGIITNTRLTITGTTAGDINYDGVKFGTYTTSTSGANLQITFLNDGSATQSRIQELLRNISFRSSRTIYSPLAWQLRYTIGEGSAVTDYNVNLTVQS